MTDYLTLSQSLTSFIVNCPRPLVFSNINRVVRAGPGPASCHHLPSTAQCITMILAGNCCSKLVPFVRNVWNNITVEPVIAMYCLIIALSSIPGEELYLKKACKVNLNHSMEICDNIYEYEAVQIETQKLVSGVQVEK